MPASTSLYLANSLLPYRAQNVVPSCCTSVYPTNRQVSRISGNYSVKLLGPHRSLPVGAASGLCGYFLAASVARFAAAEGAAAYWLLCSSLALVGLSEQIAALQDLCKARYHYCNITSRSKLLKQVIQCSCCTLCICSRRLWNARIASVLA